MTALPATMTAIEISFPGGPDVLRPVSRPVPQPGVGEVVIKVAAAGVNRPDVFQRQGSYAPPPGASDLPGLEIAGTVVAVGLGAHNIDVGDQVCALVSGGGYAEYCAAPAVQCLPIPAGLSFEEAAGVPETFFTVWTNLVDRARFTAGKTVLIHGGTSGIGTTAIQLVKAMGGRAFATAGGSEKARACEALGAERGIDYRTEDFVSVVKGLTGGQGVDIIIDMVGGDYVQRNIQAATVDGVIVSIAFLHGSKVELDLSQVMRKRLTLTGSTLRPRSVEEKGAIAKDLKAKVWPLLSAGTVRPVLFRTFPLAEASEAHRLLESSTHIGKIVLVA
jgi:putative PIG3 family NAD(P)H quinone oxidoreductase